jgi:soluble lytic murein transglycosylase
LDGEPTPEQAREARYRLAESYLLNQDYEAAIAAWEDFIASYPNDGRLSQARLMAGRASQATNECAKAVSYYEAYLATEATLADMVYEWIGDCQTSLAVRSAEPGILLEEVIAAYRQALDASDDRSVQVSLREKIADIYITREDYDAAVAEYDAILDVARIESYRAKIEYLAGQALAMAGKSEAAQERYRRNVNNYPTAEYAYLSLIELVDSGVPVDEYQRGIVDYHAGTTYPDAYGAAIRAFDRYLASEPTEKLDEALYYKALAQRALDQPEAALGTLEALIADHPESNKLADAWLEKAATLALMGKNNAAVKVYQDTAAFFPAHELAPRALWRAARLRQGEGAYAEAAKLFAQVQATFPAFEDADQALWRAGLASYQADDPEGAIANWRALVTKYPQSSFRTKTLYWLGKLGATPDSEEEEKGYWDQLVAADPHGYYALRVNQIQSGESLTATRLISDAIEAPAWNATQAEEEILTWLRGWTQVPTATQLTPLPATLERHVGTRRGEALLAVGLRREALEAFDSLRASAWQDPLALAQVTLYFHEQGLNGLAARTAYRLVGLWPGGTVYDAPRTLQRLAYPLVYADLLSAEAQARALDPLLLAALVRQESLFEPVAESYAGARGLGQVMPATGEGIARNLGIDDFDLDDLYRPSVSIRFGAYYLAVQMGRFDDQILLSLAAYNGGPGNTLYWLELGGDDLDLFVEVITASQSRIYLQRVYEQYLIYETLYRASETGRQQESGGN